jgi:hypothetical protein
MHDRMRMIFVCFSIWLKKLFLNFRTFSPFIFFSLNWSALANESSLLKPLSSRVIVFAFAIYLFFLFLSSIFCFWLQFSWKSLHLLFNFAFVSVFVFLFLLVSAFFLFPVFSLLRTAVLQKYLFVCMLVSPLSVFLYNYITLILNGFCMYTYLLEFLLCFLVFIVESGFNHCILVLRVL